MSAVLSLTIRDDAQELLRQHKGDSEAAIIACLLEIDRLGLLLERVTVATSYGYAWGRIRNPRTVAAAPGVEVEVLDY